MSVIVQGLNGRRATVKVTPNTSILQILEEACKKLKLDPDLYELKRGRNTVDPSSTVRFSNLPNNCKLELVEAATPRTSSSVVVVLVTGSGERLEKEFSPKCTLQEVLESHEKAGVKDLLPLPESGEEAVVVYAMRQVRGDHLASTTLKDLGVTSGKCMLRCLRQSRSTTGQAHVGEALSRPKKTHAEEEEEDHNQPSSSFHNTTIDEETLKLVTTRGLKRAMEMTALGLESVKLVTAIGVENARAMTAVGMENAKRATAVGVQRAKRMRTLGVESAKKILSLILRKEPVSEPAESSCSSSSTSFSASSTSTSQPSTSFSAPTNSFTAPAASDTLTSKQDLPAASTSQECSAGREGNTGTESVGLQSSYGAEREEPMEVEYDQEEEDGQEEVIIIGDHNAILFSLDDAPPTKVFEPSDDFFEHDLTDVRRLYHEYRNTVKEIEEAPLQTKQMREFEREARLLRAINQFPKTQLRICFPDKMVIQGTFKPQNTVSEVMEFIKHFLVDSNMDFSLYTTFPRVLLDPEKSLVDSELIPNARVDFVPAATSEVYLKPDTLAKKSSFRAACRAVERKKPLKEKPSFATVGSTGLMSVSGRLGDSSSCTSMPSSSCSSTTNEETQQPKRQCLPGKAGDKEVPKWFKMGK